MPWVAMHKFSNYHHPRNFLKLPFYGLRPKTFCRADSYITIIQIRSPRNKFRFFCPFYTLLSCAIWKMNYNVKHFPGVLIINRQIFYRPTKFKGSAMLSP